MNAPAILWARGVRVGGAIEKGVLLQLAAAANDDGVCLISRADLAQRAELSRSAVERVLITLGANGFIRRVVAAEYVEIELLMGKPR